MSDLVTIESVLGPGGKLAASMPGYEHRRGQLQMAHAVARALAGEQVLLVEAGTGTGKTLAYLLPALLSGKKVVVSTGTKALQDQIFEHDLPLLARHLGSAPRVAVMKGLSNYVCLRRYAEFKASADSLTTRAGKSLPLLQEWVERTQSGDRAELSGLHEHDQVFSEVQSGTDTRIGPRCVYYEDCFVTRMKARAQAAQLVVVNHHLFFADLALRGDHPGGAIPDYDAVIFDEAHLIEDVATDFFGVTVSTTRLQTLLRDAGRALAAAGAGRAGERLIESAAEAGATFFAALPRASGGEGARLPLSTDAFDARLEPPLFALDNALDALASFCKRSADASEAVLQIGRRADKLRDDLATVAEGKRERVSYTQTRGKHVSLGTSPIDISHELRDRLFLRGTAVVLTSATLALPGASSEGSAFSFVRSRLGIDFEPQELQVDSPFDYGSQAALYLPGDLPDPRDPDYLDRAERRIRELVALTDGGALVLCTSYRVLHALAERFKGERDRAVLVQGQAPSTSLLERFRRDGRAVLLATASFWQGVDVPGQALRLLIIDRLPFDVPADPLVAARSERLRERGQQPFTGYFLPLAALSLKQGLGRLIRTRKDRGIAAILDTRLTKKGYGKTLLRSMPPAARCYSMAEVTAFWKGS